MLEALLGLAMNRWRAGYAASAWFSAWAPGGNEAPARVLSGFSPKGSMPSAGQRVIGGGAWQRGLRIMAKGMGAALGKNPHQSRTAPGVWTKRKASLAERRAAKATTGGEVHGSGC